MLRRPGPSCVYAPETRLPQLPTRTEILPYTDVTGTARAIEIANRRPEGATGLLPVVIWSHGGADGTASANGVGAEWSRVFTSAGYLFIGVAHRGRDAAGRTALCSHLGFDADGCMRFKVRNWDRPHDLRTVLDWLESPDASLAGVADLSRIACGAATA